jgi:hypothetical protein
MSLASLTHTLLAVVLLAPVALPAAEVSATSVPGQRVFSAGHSFHFFMPPILTEVCALARIDGHKQVGEQALGGSQVLSHWNLDAAKNTVRSALENGEVDVLTVSPLYLPDAGIEKFAEFGLAHNSQLRITVQEFWLPFDDVAAWNLRPKQVDHNALSIRELRRNHEAYFREMDAHIAELNKKLGRTVLFVVPVGQAVLDLREAVAGGRCPGITDQNRLFTDPVGHPETAVKLLTTYCHFAVIYRRSPVGLPVPTVLAKRPEAEQLNALLQTIAWKAVTSHPLSGVQP